MKASAIAGPIRIALTFEDLDELKLLRTMLGNCGIAEEFGKQQAEDWERVRHELYNVLIQLEQREEGR